MHLTAPSAIPKIDTMQKFEFDAQRSLQQEDHDLIQALQTDLRRCSDEIQMLQDRLNLRHVEANCMAEHVHGLELKLAEAHKLNEELVLLRCDLNKSESERLLLVELLDRREIELEAALSLESQCEVEAVKLDLVAMENRCCDAETARDKAILERNEMESWVQELERRLEKSQERIGFLEKENRNVLDKLEKFETSFRKLQDLILDGVDTSGGEPHVMGDIDSSDEEIFTRFLWNTPESSIYGMDRTYTCADELGPTLVKLATVMATSGRLKGQMEKMSRQIIESELLVTQLKEELKVEKLKAKEEGEDLTQEMAEFRYQITDMLEQECKRRACIEHASLQRIEELEAQVRKERRRFSLVNSQLSKVRKLFESGSVQSQLNSESLEVSEGNQDCKCHTCTVLKHAVDLEEWRTSEENHSGNELNQPTIGWHSC